jgi:hypothetical protein
MTIETEQRRTQPLILGVRHQLTHLPKTLLFLDKLTLKDKVVMLEVSSYPIPIKYKTANQEFYEFFSEIGKKILENGGVIVSGDSENLLDEAVQKLDAL